TPVLQAIVLPLYFISGFFIPSEAIPAWLLHIADVFPFRPLGLALLTAFDPATTGSGFKPGYPAVILAWGVAGLVVASRRFSWSAKGFCAARRQFYYLLPRGTTLPLRPCPPPPPPYSPIRPPRAQS